MHLKRYKSTILLISFSMFAIAYYAWRGPTSGLDAYADITAKDPLIYDKLLKSDELQNELKRIEKNEAELSKNQGMDDKIFATAHLKILPEIKSATEEFIANPSIEKADNLIFAQKKFVGEYKKSAQNYLEVLEDIYFAKKSEKIIFFGSATTPQIIMEDIQLVIDNADELEREITARENCLKDGPCPKVKASDFSIQLPAESASSMNFLNSNIFNSSQVYSLLGIYEEDTGCFGFDNDMPKKQYFYLFEKNGVLIPKLATENYYMVVEKFKNFDEFSKKLWERGKKYDLQLETLGYRCTDLTYWPKIIAQHYVSKNGLGNMPRDLLWTLPEILKTIPSIDFLLQNSKIEKDPIPRNYLFTVHTAYSIFYLPFSPSVWRLDEQPRYLLQENFDLGDYYITFDQLQKLKVKLIEINI